MSPCPRFAPLLLDEAAGELGPEGAARLEAHRRGCAACRAEGAALADVLSLARLPPVSEAERRALDGLAASIARAQRRKEAGRLGLRVGGAVAALAAAAALVLLLPPARTAVGPAGQAAPAAGALAAWQAPDPETLWGDADLFDDEAGTTTTAAEAALAALDD